MSSVVIAGDTSGTVTLQAPSVAGTTTLTLPSTSGTVITGTGGVTSVANGGTGSNTLTANNVLLGNGTSALQVVAPSTNGNVLTSNGTTWTSAAPPSSTPTTAQVQSAMSGSSVGALGTFGLFWFSGTANPGATSSSISYSNCAGDTNGSPSGTWRCMAYSFGGGTSKQVTVWLRIS